MKMKMMIKLIQIKMIIKMKMKLMGMKKKKFVMEQFLGRGKDQACSNSASLAFLSRMVFSIIMSLTFIRRVVAERSLSSSFMVM